MNPINPLLLEAVVVVAVCAAWFFSPGTAAARLGRAVWFVLFYGLFLLGAGWGWVRFTLELRAMQQATAPPPMLPLWKLHLTPTLDYLLNGLVFAAALLVLVLLVQLLRPRTRRESAWTVLAFLVALAVSLAFRVGLTAVVPAA